MNQFFLVAHIISAIGILISVVYYVLDIVQFRRLENLVQTPRPIAPPITTRETSRKYVSRYRSKMIQRQLINEINRINGKLRVKMSTERYELFYNSHGDLRLRTVLEPK
ncbi:uncharacterized protein LOC129740017 [Uranotaenia lowii]|uniref:uncharacterized protein LOC129740017 n=1 Tax=Uranotaenia lowii TaxID=190385 RepID=UPI00247A8021|nr:uncharacterized protein LOC129740017 [Uranotaenia lowii]